MICTKLEDLDKENPNYPILLDLIEKGAIQIFENECRAVIYSKTPEYQDAFKILGQASVEMGIASYLASNHYSVGYTK